MHAYSSFKSLLAVTVLTVLLSGCNDEIHVNKVQPISKSDAAFPLETDPLYYNAISAELFFQVAADNKSDSKLTYTDLAMIREARYIPLHESGVTLLKRSGHCYQVKSIGGAGSNELKYVSYEHLEGNLYLESLSADGCFDQGQGSSKPHVVSVVRIQDGTKITVKFRAPEGSSVEIPAFNVWAHGLGKTKKWWLNLETRVDYTQKEDKHKYIAEVSDTKAYRAYFDAHKAYMSDVYDSLLASGNLTPTQKLVMARLEQIKKEEEAEKQQAEQQTHNQYASTRQAQPQPRYQAPRQPRHQRNYAATTGIDSLDVGDGVYVQGFFSDELAMVVRIDRQSNMVKVRRSQDGTTKWVPYSNILSREESYANNAKRAAVGVAVFVCIISPDTCKAQ